MHRIALIIILFFVVYFCIHFAKKIPANNFLRVGIRQKNETNKRLLIGFDEKTGSFRIIK